MVNDSSARRDDEGAVHPDDAVEELAAGLFSLARVLRSLMQRTVAGDGVLARGDAPLLRLLAACGPLRPGQIAGHLGIGPSAVSRHLTALTDGDLVVRRADPADRRAELVEITDDGRERLSEVRERYVALMRGHFGHWSQQQIHDAATTLEALTEALSVSPGSDGPAALTEEAR